jgi:hypothetical protein
LQLVELAGEQEVSGRLGPGGAPRRSRPVVLIELRQEPDRLIEMALQRVGDRRPLPQERLVHHAPDDLIRKWCYIDMGGEGRADEPSSDYEDGEDASPAEAVPRQQAPCFSESLTHIRLPDGSGRTLQGYGRTSALPACLPTPDELADDPGIQQRVVLISSQAWQA